MRCKQIRKKIKKKKWGLSSWETCAFQAFEGYLQTTTSSSFFQTNFLFDIRPPGQRSMRIKVI
jgi:hypothetical protein